jgi:hypothetical protein
MDRSDVDGALRSSCVRRERLTELSATDASQRAESVMGHIQHLSLESLVKMDHFKKEVAPCATRFPSFVASCAPLH